MFCKYLKLTNGEDLIVSTDDTCETFRGKEFIDVKDPVLISVMRFNRGSALVESFVMLPWIKMGKTESVKIPVQNIVAAVDVQKLAEDQYKMYIENVPQQLVQQEEIVPEDEIDDFINEMTNEEDDDDGNDTRTLH